MGGPRAEVLDVLPVAIMVLDGECRVVMVNQSARALLAVEGEVAGRWPGALIRCVAAVGEDDGCGQSSRCGHCLLWQSLAHTLHGGEAVGSREIPLEVVGTDGATHRVFLTTTALVDGVFGEEGGRLVLVVQDITALRRLSGMVPICAKCKRVRRPDEGWESVEAFIEDSRHALFTHTLCPTCADAYYRELDRDGPPAV